MTPFDLTPAGDALLRVVDSVTEEDLDRPTPCEGRTVGQLLGHLNGLTQAFRAAADKNFGPLTDTSPDEDGWAHVGSGWREDLHRHVPQLATAWQAGAAWQDMTRAGGLDLPGEIAGLVALDELVLHSWDLARAVGQPYVIDDATAAASLTFVEGFDPGGTPGLFGPAVEVHAASTPLERLVARSGRDPRWGA